MSRHRQRAVTAAPLNNGAGTSSALFLTGAGLPFRHPRLAVYEQQILDFLADSGIDSGEHYQSLSHIFSETCREIFGAGYHAYFTRGTLPAFQQVVLRFWQAFPDALLVATPFEYLPMVYSVPAGRRVIAPVTGSGATEERWIHAMCDSAEQRLNGLSLAERRRRPVCLLVSSELRCGGNRLDIARMRRVVDERNRAWGFPCFQLWVDASQDYRIFREADLVWYSKRLAGTGSGLMLMRRATFDADPTWQSVLEAGRIRSGYPLNALARLIAALFVLREGLQQPEAWRDQAAQISDAVRSGLRRFHGDLDLDRYFRVVLPRNTLQDNGGLPHTIIRLVWSHPVSRPDGIARLAQRLKQEAEIEVDWFDLSRCDGEPGLRLADIQAAVADETQPLEAVKDVLDRFQFAYQDVLTRALCVWPLYADRAHVAAELDAFVAHHRYLRLFITAADPPGALLRLFTALNELCARLVVEWADAEKAGAAASDRV